MEAKKKKLVLKVKPKKKIVLKPKKYPKKSKGTKYA